MLHKNTDVGHCRLWTAGYRSCGKSDNVAWSVMNFSKMIRRNFPFFLLFLMTAFPGNAWAVQSHGAPEGLYVHQLAHVFYTAALCYFFWNIHRSKFKSPGWRLLQVFCVLMACWNIMAFADHTLASEMNSAHITAGTGYLSTRLQGPATSTNIWYYITKLDHIFSVPALFFLYLGMKGIYKSSIKEEEV